MICIGREYGSGRHEIVDGKKTNLRLYNVRMNTPIGVRLGQMTVLRNLDTISGYLDILRHREPFEGTIDSDGNCKIMGKIVTLMRAINYVAIGKITSDSLTLSITDDCYVLEITGTVCCP